MDDKEKKGIDDSNSEEILSALAEVFADETNENAVTVYEKKNEVAKPQREHKCIVVSWFRSLFKKEPKATEEHKPKRGFSFKRKPKVQTPNETTIDKAVVKKKTGAMLRAIESQLFGLDEQNKVLMYHLATMRDNNESLLEQVNTLKKNNEMLLEQFQMTVRKNKFQRILNIIYTILSLGFVVYRMALMIIQNG